MLVKSEDLPLGSHSLLRIQTFCTEAQNSGRLIVYGGVHDELRQDYLNEDLPLPARAISHITVKPARWRMRLDGACLRVAQSTLQIYGTEVIVHYLWRAGLAFLPSFNELGVRKHAHFGLRRNEQRPDKTEEIYLSADENFLKEHHFWNHIIADVMLATGGSLITYIKTLHSLGVKTSNIALASVIAAPEGIYNLLNEYPDLTIFVGQLDDHLDKTGYIVPGLGDAGDKMFSGLSLTEFELEKDLFSKQEWNLLKEKINQANLK